MSRKANVGNSEKVAGEVVAKKERKKREMKKIIAVEIKDNGLFPVEGFPEVTSKKDAWEWAKNANAEAKEPKTIYFYRACGAFRMTQQLMMNFEMLK